MKRKIALMLICGMIAGSVFAQSDLQPLVTISVYKTESITLKELKNRVATWQKQYSSSSFTVDQKKEILNALIDEKLVVQAAKKNGISITDEQIDQTFVESLSKQVGKSITVKEFTDLVRKQKDMSLDEFFLDQVGMNVQEYKDFLKAQLFAKQYVWKIKENEITAASVPTDEEIRTYYEMNQTKFSQSDILKVFMVFVPKDEDEKAAKAEADSVYAQFKNGSITMDQMIEASKAGNAKYKAGYMYIDKSSLAAQKLNMSYTDLLSLFDLDINTISTLTDSKDTYRFYEVCEKKDAKILTLSDVIQPTQPVTVYEYIKYILGLQKQQKVFETALKEVTKDLRTPGNFTMLKSGENLDALLNW